MDKRERELRRFLKKRGYKIIGRTGGTHFVAYSDEQEHKLICSSSPRRFNNMLKHLQRTIDHHRRGWKRNPHGNG